MFLKEHQWRRRTGFDPWGCAIENARSSFRRGVVKATSGVEAEAHYEGSWSIRT